MNVSWCRKCWIWGMYYEETLQTKWCGMLGIKYWTFTELLHLKYTGDCLFCVILWSTTFVPGGSGLCSKTLNALWIYLLHLLDNLVFATTAFCRSDLFIVVCFPSSLMSCITLIIFQFIIMKRTHFMYIMTLSCLLTLWVWSGWILILVQMNQQVNYEGYFKCPVKEFLLEKHLSVMLSLNNFFLQYKEK